MFSYRRAPTEGWMAIQAMTSYSRHAGVVAEGHVYGNALIQRSRNSALVRMGEDSTHALFVDDDMLPEKDFLQKLLAHGLPVVSGLCTTRGADCRIAAKAYDREKDEFALIDAVKPNILLQGDFGVGAAFCLMDRATVEALIEYYLSARDWLTEERRALDRLHVRTEWRERERERKEKIRRGHYAREQYVRVFAFPVTDDELEMGEDICFSRRLIQLGIPVAIDTGVAVGHIGDYPYGVWDVLDRKAKESTTA